MNRSIFLATAAVLVLTGCGEDSVAPAPPDETPIVPEPLTWRHTQRTPVSELLHDVDGFGDVHIAVGEGGTVLLKHGAEDWLVLDERLDAPLRRVEMTKEKTAVVLGGTDIYRTVDGGREWKVVGQAASALRDVSVLGDFGIAVGVSGMMRTIDGGESWSALANVPSASFVAVAVLDAQTAIASAVGRLLFRTEDGGETWNDIAVAQIDDRVEHLVFYTEKLGTAATNPARVFWTDDGGDTWSERASFGVNGIRNLDRIDEETGYAVLETGHVHVTHDAGKSWAFETVIPQNEGSVTGIDASDDAAWYAVGEFGFVSETRNTGTSWSRLTEGRVGVFRAVAFFDESDGIAAYDPRFTETERALLTGDGGNTWVAVDPAIANPTRVLASDAGPALMLGDREVSVSNDRGLSWTNVSPPVADGLRGGAVLDALTYLVCGFNTTIFRTADGGATWNDVSGGVSGDELTDVAFFADGVTGVIVGPEKSFRSVDAGETWTQVNLRAESIAIVGDDVAIAVGDEILRSVDRGATWEIVLDAGSLGLDSLVFLDALHGVAVGPLGRIVETLDGGLTWDEVDGPTSVSLHSVAARGADGAVIGGASGAVVIGTP